MFGIQDVKTNTKIWRQTCETCPDTKFKDVWKVFENKSEHVSNKLQRCLKQVSTKCQAKRFQIMFQRCLGHVQQNFKHVSKNVKQLCSSSFAGISCLFFLYISLWFSFFYIHIYIYIIVISISLYMYICVYTYMCIYIYIIIRNRSQPLAILHNLSQVFTSVRNPSQSFATSRTSLLMLRITKGGERLRKLVKGCQGLQKSSISQNT